MSGLGFQLFRMSIRRTARWNGLRYICSEPWMGRGVNRPSSEELGLTPFRLLGPPEVPPSTFTVNSYPDDADQDPIRDRLLNNRRKPYQHLGLGEDPCVFFCRSFIYKQRIDTLPKKDNSPDVLQYFLELSWRRCPQTTLKLICILRSSDHDSKQSIEDFYTAAIWLHRYHSETLAYNVAAFAKFGCLKDLLEILHRIVHGPEVLMKSKLMQKRSDTHLRNEKMIMMAKKAIERYNYNPKYRFLHNQISNLFADLLKADLEYLISGQLTKISLASKWCPSPDSSYDRSTLLCESVARKLFSYDTCPEYRELDESHYVYRVRNRLRKEVLGPLRRNFLEINGTLMESKIFNEDYLKLLVVCD